MRVMSCAKALTNSAEDKFWNDPRVSVMKRLKRIGRFLKAVGFSSCRAKHSEEAKATHWANFWGSVGVAGSSRSSGEKILSRDFVREKPFFVHPSERNHSASSFLAELREGVFEDWVEDFVKNTFKSAFDRFFAVTNLRILSRESPEERRKIRFSVSTASTTWSFTSAATCVRRESFNSLGSVKAGPRVAPPAAEAIPL